MSEKTRISVTVTETILADFDRIIEDGRYLSRGEIILDAFRLFIEDYYWKSRATRERS